MSRYVLAVVLVDPFLVTYGDPIKVWEAEVEGGQRWCEFLVIRLIVLWSRGSNIIIIDVKMLRQWYATGKIITIIYILIVLVFIVA